MDRTAVHLQSPIYADWQFEAAVLASEPNPDPLPVPPLVVDADYGDLRPGGVVVFETLDGRVSQAREVQKLTVLSSGHTELYTIDLTPPPADPWTLGNLRVFGNVARVTHGETHEEILGGSDGVTMFLRFELKKAPLTRVPGADGGEPAIDVFVNDVRWTRVDDFFGSTPHDRHYRIEFDDQHVAGVVFGNGIRGAIPASGRKHIRAVFRQGLGAIGNVDRRAASRIKKAHPLVTGATNPAPLIGGADASGLADLQRQSTRFIRTFDRAVSIQDYADLALLFPGVARAAARPHGAGLQVIVATVDGGEPPLDAVRAFLDARRDETLPLDVLGPDPVDVWLDLVIEHDPALLTENVKRGVQDALVGEDARGPGLFTFPAREFGQAAHLSEVYERVGGPHGVAGVTFVDVTRFRIGDFAGAFDVLQVSAQQWLRLLPGNLTIQITAGAAV
jgi:predicted phage baseplate assembly protein